MLPLVGALHSPKLEQKMSTILSFDLRRKTKHHRQRNSSTTITPTPAPKTDGNQEEMEFTLRVCLFNLTKLRVHTNVKRKQIHCFMQVSMLPYSSIKTWKIIFLRLHTEF